MKRGKAVPSRSPLAEAFDVIPAEAEIDHFHPSADLGFCPSVARSAFSKIRPIFLFAYSWVLLRSSRDRLSVRTLPQLGVSHDVQVILVLSQSHWLSFIMAKRVSSVV